MSVYYLNVCVALCFAQMPFSGWFLLRRRRNAQGKWNADALLENFNKSILQNFVRKADKKRQEKAFSFFCMRSFNAKMTNMFWFLCCLDASTRTSGAGQSAAEPAAQHLTKT